MGKVIHMYLATAAGRSLFSIWKLQCVTGKSEIKRLTNVQIRNGKQDRDNTQWLRKLKTSKDK